MERQLNILELEINSFMENLNWMLGSHRGEYVAFRGNNHTDFYESEGDCIKEAYKKWGNVPFLARQISKDYITFGKYGRLLDMFNLAA